MRPLACGTWGPLATFRARPFSPKLAALAPDAGIGGSLSVTQEDDQVSAATVLALVAVLTVAQVGDGITANGVIGVTASAGLFDIADGLAASVGETISASANIANAADGLAGAAAVRVGAVASLSDGPDTLIASKAAVVGATVAQIDAVDVLSSSASVSSSSIGAAVAITDGPDGLVGQFKVFSSGANNLMADDDSLSGAGSISIGCGVLWIENNDTCHAAVGSASYYAIRVCGRVRVGRIMPNTIGLLAP